MLTRVSRARTRQRVPVPAPLLGLAAGLLALEVSGWFVRVLDTPAGVRAVLSMDAPWSIPRSLVALVFLVAALAAAAGAVTLQGRRTWWVAIAAVTGLVALVKAGSTVHVRALQAIGGEEHPVRGLVVFGTAAGLGLVWLYWLSRHERRDRRRVLLWLGLYGAAAVGLSTLSLVVSAQAGWDSVPAATATLVEESGEALAAVGVLFAVLLGVAPRLVLPSDFPLRRPADEPTR